MARRDRDQTVWARRVAAHITARKEKLDPVSLATCVAVVDDTGLVAIDTAVPARVDGLTVDRPTDVAWVLLAIPVEQWPAVQPTIEGLQLAATFSTMVLRPHEARDGESDQDR